MNKLILSLIALALIAPVAGCKEEKKEPEKTEAAVEQPAQTPTETAAVSTSPEAVTEASAEAVAEGAAVESTKDVAVKPEAEAEPKAEAEVEVKEQPAADVKAESDAKPKTEAKEPTSTAVFKDYKDVAGKWNGPEGTWLSITQTAPTDYNIVIKDLDKETEYAAIARDGTIVFSRDGKVETIRPADGGATGMKWLSSKKQCIVVKAGEGYCKD